MAILNIRYNGTDDSEGLLSNLATKPFVFRGRYTQTIEGVLQSLKVYDPIEQSQFWSMNGFTAKKAGRVINWYDSQILWWDAKPIDRHGEEYQMLLDELYGQCYAQNSSFRQALADTKQYEFQHTIGSIDKERTILTIDEFISRLEVLRML